MTLFGHIQSHLRVPAAALILLLINCGTTIFAPKESNLARPLGLEVEPADDYRFRIKFFVSNEEEIFLGYNLYAAKVSITDADFIDLSTNRLVELILPEGEEPSFAFSNLDTDTVNQVTKTVRFFDGSRIRFECGQRYYFRLRAMGEGREFSQPSNEDSGVAKETVGAACP